MAIEAKKHLGLTTVEWAEVFANGEPLLLSKKPNEGSNDRIPTRELTKEEQVEKAKSLGKVALVVRDELDRTPREALVTAAWQGIAHYHVQGTTWGYESEHVMAFEKEKEFRVSLLTEEEKKQAISLANDWLDDNFDK